MSKRKKPGKSRAFFTSCEYVPVNQTGRYVRVPAFARIDDTLSVVE
jgi:hypothetical protein